MPKPIAQRNGKLASEQLVSALTGVLQKHLPLELKQTRITSEQAWELLAYASVSGTTLESACAALPNAPSGNRVREVLGPALPPLPILQGQLNRLLRAQLHPSLWKKPRGLDVAVDLVLVPYHGQPAQDAAEVRRGPARSGTTHFHAYATATIVHDKRRYTLAVRFVRKDETMDQVVRWLLDRLKHLKIRLRRVYLDAGFSGVPVLRVLERRRLAYLMPLPVRGRSGGVRKLHAGRSSYWGTYTLDSHTHGTCTVEVAVVVRYHKGRKKKHGRRWLVYAISDPPLDISPRQIYEWYRRRFGIESTYRLMNRVRARTSSRSPVLRLLLVGLALVLVNLYVALRQACHLEVVRPAHSAHPFQRLAFWLDRLVNLIHATIHSKFGGTFILFFRQPFTFS